jgi:hypothetical protein
MEVRIHGLNGSKQRRLFRQPSSWTRPEFPYLCGEPRRASASVLALEPSLHGGVQKTAKIFKNARFL